ncbi:hypothetical protein ABZV14_44630 [Streptosporangium canum]|uniref:hypothetical protein n=1 Tax=Streptosporangium canum TaxID=324952 RepID=UPI0033A03D27
MQGGGVQLELLSGPLTGIYDPHGMAPGSWPCSPSPPSSTATATAAVRTSVRGVPGQQPPTMLEIFRVRDGRITELRALSSPRRDS